ncbi:MAG: hypothetical protein ACTSW1_04645 [Candidatus Hodarchaeales archaeon]
MKESFLRANDALLKLNRSVSDQYRSMAGTSTRLITKFEELRYLAESIPDYIIRSDNTISNLQASGEIRVAQLLSSIICENIVKNSNKIVEALDFGEEDLDLKSEIKKINEDITKLEDIVTVQNKLADGAEISTESIKNLQKKYEKRIRQLEEQILRKEGRSLTITALDLTEKPKIFGKKKFEDNLADLILEHFKKMPVSAGGYISLANLYTEIKNQVPDIKFSSKDLEKVCRKLVKDGLISGINKHSGIKIVEFKPISLGKDARKVFALAVGKGYVTFEEVMLNTKWEQHRVKRVLEELVRQNIAQKVTSLDTGDQYYFPGLYGDKDW